MSLTIDFSNKTVVVIGGTSGINRGVAELFARHGAVDFGNYGLKNSGKDGRFLASATRFEIVKPDH